MLVLWFFRMACDLAIYYAFAGLFLSMAGGGNILPGILICSLCYTLSGAAGRNKPVRILLLLPQLLFFALPQLSMADDIAVIPPILYTFYLATTGNYALSRYRQMDVFSFFWKAYSCYFLIMLILCGISAVVQYSLPQAVVAAVLSVLLLRILRHQTEQYRHPLFFLGNLMPILLLMLLAWIFRNPAILQAAQAGILWIYNGLILPVLLLVGYVLAFVINNTLYPLFVFLANLLRSDSAESSAELDLSSASDILQIESTEVSSLSKTLFTTLGILLVAGLAVLVLVFLFRRLAGQSEPDTAQDADGQVKSSYMPGSSSPAFSLQGRSPLDPVNQIRHQYRRYLRLCRAKGVQLHSGDTSMDILQTSHTFFTDNQSADALRRLYIAARYSGTASHQDVILARQLLKKLKSSANPEKRSHKR